MKTRAQSLTDRELLMEIDDEKIAQEVHKRMFALKYSLSEREMYLEDKVMELKALLDKHDIKY